MSALHIARSYRDSKTRDMLKLYSAAANAAADTVEKSGTSVSSRKGMKKKKLKEMLPMDPTVVLLGMHERHKKGHRHGRRHKVRALFGLISLLLEIVVGAARRFLSFNLPGIPDWN